MKISPLACLTCLTLFTLSVAEAEVTFTKLEDRIRVEVDGQLFTEWQHKAWKAPYLYPVIGPNGVNVTRNFPMKEGVEGEQQDHPHHRSIRFSHRNVNGMSFWAPDSKQGGHDATIELEKIEEMKDGDIGELKLLNRWMGDGELVLTEEVTLRFQPLPDHEMLMDFDLALTAPDKDVTFFDEKDGGLGVRVAGTMKVEDRKTKDGKGTIVNSRGDKNAEAWGKKAEWCDYFGPDPSGKTVGIAIFDYPKNLRYPTNWHARTYGLLTANRFGKGFFEANEGAKKGDGDYTIKAGETLKLRHRLYFHHGSPEDAKVAERYADYVKE
ncbi:MAG: PmoA family protein [Verrucomicrobiae bacterium]|nr:PmoA family protein [Verrucomicrobiae bacterium]